MKHMLRKTAALALALCLTVALAGIALGADGGKKGVLLVAFGTSMDTGAPAYEGIEGAFRKTGEPVVWAFTSNIIRAKMAKQGVKLLTVPEGLAKLADEGVTDVTVQSLHIMAGEEYAKMERLVLTDVLAHPDRFASVKVGRPLVESMRDARDVAEAVLHSLPAARSADDAVLLMAHGQGEGRCDMVFAGMKDVVNDTDPLAFMASVEGYQGIDQVLPELQAKGAKRVWLLPFMVVAGDVQKFRYAEDAIPGLVIRHEGGRAVQPARQFIRTEAVLFARGSEGVEQGFIVRRKDGPVPVFQAVRQHAEQIRRFHIEGAGEKDEPRGTRNVFAVFDEINPALVLAYFFGERVLRQATLSAQSHHNFTERYILFVH